MIRVNHVSLHLCVPDASRPGDVPSLVSAVFSLQRPQTVQVHDKLNDSSFFSPSLTLPHSLYHLSMRLYSVLGFLSKRPLAPDLKAPCLIKIIRTTPLLDDFFTQAVASVAGMGDGWDLGLTDEERKARRPSIDLRKSLSTFQDPDFRGDGSVGDSGGAAFVPPPTSPPSSPPPPPPPGAVEDGGGAPPNLRRTT